MTRVGAKTGQRAESHVPASALRALRKERSCEPNPKEVKSPRRATQRPRPLTRRMDGGSQTPSPYVPRAAAAAGRPAARTERLTYERSCAETAAAGGGGVGTLAHRTLRNGVGVLLAAVQQWAATANEQPRDLYAPLTLSTELVLQVVKQRRCTRNRLAWGRLISCAPGQRYRHAGLTPILRRSCARRVSWCVVPLLLQSCGTTSSVARSRP